MKRTLIACLTLLMALPMAAQADYGKYYANLPKPMPVVTTPVIPAHKVNLTDFGGVGDGLTMNTQAFAKAVSALTKQGGGQLVVPAGVWVTGPVSLKDNIDLHLERNAIILLSADKRDFLKTDNGATDTKAVPGISASKRKNISITGEGIIDGNGEFWRPVKRSKVSDVEWNGYKAMGGTQADGGALWYPFNLKHLPDVADSYQAQEKMRTHLVRFTDCESVLVQGVTLRNSPKFHLVPQRCNNVVIDNVKVICPWNAQNGDAIDIGNCKNVLVVNNTIDAGDDGICMKGGVGQKGADDGPCENINIQDNIVYHAHGGFVIGSEFCGGMYNIYVHNNTFAGTDTGLRFKSAVGRGGLTKDIYISNIVMTDIKDEAIVFQCDYVDRPAGSSASPGTSVSEAFSPRFTDIHISDVVCHGAKTGVKAGGAKGMVYGVEIKNSTIFYTDKDKDIAPTCDVKLENVRFATYGK